MVPGPLGRACRQDSSNYPSLRRKKIDRLIDTYIKMIKEGEKKSERERQTSESDSHQAVSSLYLYLYPDAPNRGLISWGEFE